MTNKNLLIWASDLSPNTGEGILAMAFLKEMLKFTDYRIIKIKTFEQVIYLNKSDTKNIDYKEINNNTFIHKYIGPLYGTLYLFLFSYKYQVVYLNYLPLWNFLIFLLLPKKTILGPITGGVHSGSANSFNLLIRKYFFPNFFKITKFIIYRKFKKAIFSTNILRPYMEHNNLFLYNFVTTLFHKKKHNFKKKYDIVFYNRNHPTKHSENLKNIITKLSKVCKICIIGDYFNQTNVKNFGWIARNKVHNLIKKSKVSFNSAENFLSIFSIDCINHGTPIIYDKSIKHSTKNIYGGYYYGVNFNDIEGATSKILKIIQKIKTDQHLKCNVNTNMKKKVTKFLFSYFAR
jgi:hypothetical protein